MQVHLEHRLVRRLLSRFLSQGFPSGLSRVCVIIGPGAQPRVVLLGRLALYGAGAARLHEEIILVTAAWTEAERDRKPLRPFGESGEEATLDQLEQALARRRAPAPAIAVARIRRWSQQDIADLEPELRASAAERLGDGQGAARRARRGGGEIAAAPARDQRARIAKADAEPDDRISSLLPESPRTSGASSGGATGATGRRSWTR